jgi:2-polyprenyl-3-methyl-5-hydroxy-6-metoxy-1,4-benzoquinol methylase/Zn ribbon nucleic-acid-binding protein
MLLENVSCPLCESQDSRLWAEENGFRAVRCSGCDLIFVNPRPQLQSISEANRIGQHRTLDGSLDVVFRRSTRKIRHYRQTLSKLVVDEFKHGRPVKWLDVGAGFGEVLEAILPLLPEGSEAQGIEPMAPKASAAQKRGLPVSTRLLSEVQETYDVVSLINVFSHIPDFRSFLADLKAVLKPGGILIIETGNAGDLQKLSEYPDRLFLPDHLVFAGVEHMRRFLRDGSFEIEEVIMQRRDSISYAAKNAVKRALGNLDAPLVAPYRSPFRTVFFKSRSAGAAP